MRIGVEEVRHVARLAELAVADADAERLAGELERIVALVERLGELEGAATGDPPVLGPAAVTLREDVVAPVPLARPPASFAPEMRDGFFVVPRVSGMVEE
jgi:aspartyl-tRNA(Asn)/glutamyl-tRNA(Gln) amidotransferase subunit C